MPYAYYNKLSRQDKATYRQSDSIVRVPLTAPERLRPLTRELCAALETGDRRGVRSGAQSLMTSMVNDLGAPAVQVSVLSARPAHDWGELQGLYEPEGDDEIALITVWMRTAANKRIVAFKTFLRTLLHELCHHLDYELFELEESFHTEGFFKRESSLFHQIVGDSISRPAPAASPLFD